MPKTYQVLHETAEIVEHDLDRSIGSIYATREEAQEAADLLHRFWAWQAQRAAGEHVEVTP